jgi:predicted alpha/beta hydrolase family esterase
MKTAIILHGRPRKSDYFNLDFPAQSNSHWIPWLQQQLLVNGYLAQTPEIPEPYDPLYQNWIRELERYELTPETLLVGHSCGGGVLVRWLSENKDKKIGKVVLVAPWIDLEKNDWPLFDFKLDEKIAERTEGLALFHSIDDDPEIVSSVKELRAKVKNMKYVEFQGRGHFTHHYMPDDKFPELLQECLAGNT